MNKTLGILYFIGSLIWCLQVIPFVSLGLTLASFNYLFIAIDTHDSIGIVLGLLYIVGSFFMAYLTIKFGFSLVKYSINKFRGIKSPTMLQIIKKERLLKIKT